MDQIMKLQSSSAKIRSRLWARKLTQDPENAEWERQLTTENQVECLN